MLFSLREILSGLIPLIFFAISLYSVTWLADGLSLIEPDSDFKSNRAVLAIRDSVPSFQQFGTELFTGPYLKSYYDKSFYFTQKTKKDKKEEIIEALVSLAKKYETVDIFLLAHTNKYLLWFQEVPLELRRKIRLVYNTGCHNANQGKEWLYLGADSYIGHKGKCSLSPFFYVYFLRRWVSGYSLKAAVDESNEKAKIEISILDNFLPDPGEMNYVDQSYGHLYGSETLIIDKKP